MLPACYLSQAGPKQWKGEGGEGRREGGGRWPRRILSFVHAIPHPGEVDMAEDRCFDRRRGIWKEVVLARCARPRTEK